MSKNYFWGAPASHRERELALDAIRGTLRPGTDLSSLLPKIEGFINRVTDKTSGLLTVAGIVLAISLFAAERGQLQLSIAAAVLTIWAMVLLALNLGTVWRTNQIDWTNDTEFFEVRFHVFSRRAVRLQVSLWLILTSSCLCLVAFAQSAAAGNCSS